jgi:hypothetical protein
MNQHFHKMMYVVSRTRRCNALERKQAVKFESPVKVKVQQVLRSTPSASVPRGYSPLLCLTHGFFFQPLTFNFYADR